MMRHNKWKKLVILTSTDGVYFESGCELALQLEAAGMEVLKPAAFEPSHFNEATLSTIGRSGFRIVILLAYGADTKAIASRSGQQEMNGAGWAWVVVCGEGW